MYTSSGPGYNLKAILGKACWRQVQGPHPLAQQPAIKGYRDTQHVEIKHRHIFLFGNLQVTITALTVAMYPRAV
jgi:hypothetical protein